MSETLYVKRGRRYVPHLIAWDYNHDQMRVGTWRMTYAYSDGGRRYEYEVRPDTASFMAAAMMAREEMVRTICDKAVGTPSGQTIPYTKRQLAIIGKFKADMMAAGGLVPTWWTSASAADIAQAGIDAVRNWKDKP